MSMHTTKRFTQPLIFLTAFVVWPLTAMADVYKTVDAQGEVVYSDTPPQGQASEDVKLGPTPTAEQIREAEEQQRTMERSTAELEQAREQYEAEMQNQQPQPPVVVSPLSGPVVGSDDAVVVPGTVYPAYRRPYDEERRENLLENRPEGGYPERAPERVPERRR